MQQINQTMELSSNNTPSENVFDSVTMPALTYQQSFNCSDFWMRSNLTHFFESLCVNETNIENCVFTLLETNAAVLMHHCQFEVWINTFFVS